MMWHYLFVVAALAGVGDVAPEVAADWVLQEEHLYVKMGDVSPETDAAGGCDGVKNGKWGFHTEHVEQPWWQVDLGASRPVARVALWNRCDGTAGRTDAIEVLLSDDGATWRIAYQHKGPTFQGFTDKQPLVVALNESTRYVRLQLPGTNYLHLDEVEVFSPEGENIALNRPATQIGVSQWSTSHRRQDVAWHARAQAIGARCEQLATMHGAAGTPLAVEAEAAVRRAFQGEDGAEAYRYARTVQRELLFADPLLDFDAILFVKRAPGSYSHMSDQYYGWWSRPGGGLYLLRDYKTAHPRLECLTDKLFPEPGSFLRPSLSFDGQKVLFAWCRHYPELAACKDKFNKDNVPEDAFYHVYEMALDGTGLRQLTRGKYDDFDARHLPDGRIVFLSTRRGRTVRCTPETAARTLTDADLPDSYVRCGGGLERPVAVYTLHTMDADGGSLCPISPFEMFEWTPCVGNDGALLYSRWDYVDRSNMPYMSLWSIHPDGANARLVYGNFTRSPHCTFEPQPVPNSRKIVFTASGHHAQTMGSLVLYEPAAGNEGEKPLQRLTPEVCFPESEGWPSSFYTSPWPLSERLYLTSWGVVPTAREGSLRPVNDMGLYLFDAEGRQMELLHRDPELACECPLPVRARPRPPVIPAACNWAAAKEGCFFVADVYKGLKLTAPGTVKGLRIVAVPVKTHPTMNQPALGATKDDPGKCVIGTVPVEADGSAYFRAPAGIPLFFQALDAQGFAVHTMRSATHVQPGQTLGCVGCHEPRTAAPPSQLAAAGRRSPSKITPGPEGTWPWRFDKLVQPVLDRHCTKCHNPQAPEFAKSRLDFAAANAYESLVAAGKPAVGETALAAYQRGASLERSDLALASPIVALLQGGHHQVALDDADMGRLALWLDIYAQRLGAFDDEQEQELLALRREMAPLLAE